MINRINAIIEVNLELLYKAKNNLLDLNDFKDDFGKQFQDPKSFARLMQIKKLVSKHCEYENSFRLTEFGKVICENRGWLDYLKNQNEKVMIAEKSILTIKKRTKWFSSF
jgi:hypothetical protein